MRNPGSRSSVKAQFVQFAADLDQAGDGLLADGTPAAFARGPERPYIMCHLVTDAPFGTRVSGRMMFSYDSGLIPETDMPIRRLILPTRSLAPPRVYEVKTNPR